MEVLIIKLRFHAGRTWWEAEANQCCFLFKSLQSLAKLLGRLLEQKVLETAGNTVSAETALRSSWARAFVANPAPSCTQGLLQFEVWKGPCFPLLRF